MSTHYIANFSADTINFLATLGWKAEDFCETVDRNAPHWVKHAVTPRLIVRRPSHRSKAHSNVNVFVLEGDGRQYPDRGLEIESKTVDTTKPQWQKTVMLWYTRAVFMAEQIRIVAENEDAEAAAKQAAFESKIHALMPEDCTVGIEDVNSVAHFTENYEGQGMRVTLRSYTGWNFPAGASTAQRAAMACRLTRTYIELGFVKN